jgi:hypothetical protein
MLANVAHNGGRKMVTNIDIVSIQPLVALLFGILILILPRILNYLIAIYLILVGVIGLYPHILHGSLH